MGRGAACDPGRVGLLHRILRAAGSGSSPPRMAHAHRLYNGAMSTQSRLDSVRDSYTRVVAPWHQWRTRRATAILAVGGFHGGTRLAKEPPLAADTPKEVRLSQPW
jgi:hypothetical protein